jgi:hypothetical protein
VDPEISIRGPVLFKEQKNRISKQFAIRKIKKIPRQNSKRKLKTW